MEKDFVKMKEDCTNLLTVSDCLVEFTKADGSNRKMLCTLRKDAVQPADENVPFSRSKYRNRPENKDILVVWDLEASEGKGDWRSFRLDRIKSFKSA
jgi:hypothetical protein